MKKNQKSRLIIVGIILLVVVAAIAGGIYYFNSPQTSPTNVAKVSRGDISASVNASGKVRPKKMANLVMSVGGVVAKIEKLPGDTVKPGDVILTLRPDESINRRIKQAEMVLQSRLLDFAQAKSAPRDEDIEIARANLKKVTMALAIAESNYNTNPTKQNEAYRESARIDLDIATASFNRTVNGATQEQLTALQNSIASAQMDLDSARLTLTQTQLTAPFTATVTEIEVREDELFGGGVAAVIADLSALEILADVDEIDVANVKVGQNVDVRLDAFSGEKFTGKLMRLYPSATPQRGSTVYSALIDFDLRGFYVRPGMGANLKIQTTEKKSVLLVPNRAIKNVGTRKAVRVLAPGEPRDVIVETGVTDGIQTEIVSGINEGDVVQVN